MSLPILIALADSSTDCGDADVQGAVSFSPTLICPGVGWNFRSKKPGVPSASSGTFHTRIGKGKTDTAFFAFDNYSFSETQTNPANGKFVTITANASFREIRAKRVEGTVFEFWAVEAGQFRMYDSDGRLVARDRGSVQFHILFDTEGDDVPGGVQIEEFPPKVHGPHLGFDDFCGLITPLIGS